jgi:prepilin-type N-terminal cleavage/methylation domain-containing protein
MNTRLRLRKDDRGFTLIELLIVIVVLGVLAGVTVLSVGGIGNRGNAAACRSDFKSVEVAQQAFYAQTRGYAASVTALVGANYLASEPTNAGYTIVTSAADNGKVTVTIGAVTGGPLADCTALN